MHAPGAAWQGLAARKSLNSRPIDAPAGFAEAIFMDARGASD